MFCPDSTMADVQFWQRKVALYHCMYPLSFGADNVKRKAI